MKKYFFILNFLVLINNSFADNILISPSFSTSNTSNAPSANSSAPNNIFNNSVARIDTLFKLPLALFGIHF